MEEALQIIRACFDSPEPVDFAGTHFRLQGGVLDLPVPAGRKPVVWLASHGPRMLRLAGTYADGWFPTFAADPQVYEEGRRSIQRTASGLDRDLANFTWSFQATTVLATTDDRARSVLEESLATRYIAVIVGSGALWAEAGADHPFGEDWRGFVDALPETIPEAELRAAVARVPFEVLDHMYLWGSPATIVSKVRDLGDAGLNHVALLPLSALVDKRLYRTFGLSLRSIVRALTS